MRKKLELKTHELSKHGICYVPQGKINFSNLTIEENLLIAGNEEQLSQVYATFPVLKEKRNIHAWTLSGGQHQMLALGRAMMQQPELLLLDEPSLGLSPKLQRELFERIALFKNKMAILIVEQNAKQAIAISDHTYLLEDGKVVLHGGKDILKNPKIKEVYLGGRY